MPIVPRADDVLIIVDMQYDFLPGGSLAVAGGDQIIAPITALAQRFDTVVMTQDWHPADHISFASNHPGKHPFETIELGYGTQVLWPDHCVIGSRGAALVDGLDPSNAHLIIRKGFHREVDSYSGFHEADRQTRTGLAGYLRERSLRRVFVVGLATDFCVGWTALDARAAGFETFVIEDATRGIDADGSLARAWAEMEKAGVGRILAAEVG
ncbi:MAG TPA: bifunctional nicotinamidase/pyrazinamidase [Arsenicitalea sp.]|nr:bifunctional nicotinamidase/pyrazinamidase [Arsenicitalea sp.]